MARLEKRYDRQGKLIWAKGAARDIYKDEAIADSKGGGYRIAGEARLYNILLPRHCAGNILGEQPSDKNLHDLMAKLPPFKEWQFVLVAVGKHMETQFEIANEISGDVVVEVDILAKRGAV